MSDRPAVVALAPGLGVRDILTTLMELAERLLNAKSTLLAQPVMYPPGAPKVNRAILKVKTEVREIPKSGYNKESKYSFVEWAVLSARLQDAMVKSGLVIAQREVNRAIQGKVLFIKYQYDAYWTDADAAEGQFILNISSNTGACRFEFKSGTTDDKAANKCQTAGLKSMTISLFKIPADVDDIERDAVTLPEGDRRDDAREQTGRRQPPDDRGAPADDRRSPPPDDRGAPADDRRESTTSRGTAAWNPPDDRGRADDNDSRWGGSPPDQPDYGGAPGDDAPPFGDPGKPAPAAVSPGERDYRQNVEDLGRALKQATSQEDSARIWVENADIIQQMTDNTYEFFRENFHSRWNAAPPRT